MRIIRLILSAIGVLLVLIGLIWIGQGSGLFPYPATSFMINQTPWIINGAVAALAGVLLIAGSRKFFS